MVKTILYISGALIVGLMAIGLAVNYLPIDKPLLSIYPVIIFWLGVLIALYLNRKRIYIYIKGLKLKFNKTRTVLLVLPVISIIGANIVNKLDNNVLLMILMVLLAIVPVCSMIFKWIKPQDYAFTIWIVALSIILHRVLIGELLWGSDNILEYGVFRTTLANGYWDSNAQSVTQVYNTSLAVSILPAMIHRIFGISEFWIFKVVLPIILSLVPLATYQLVRYYFNKKIAFLSAFTVISVYTFFTTMICVNKQLIALVLIAICLVAFYDITLSKKNKTILLISLGCGVIVSHYSMAALFLVILAPLAIITIIKKRMTFWNVGLICVVLVSLFFAWYLTQSNGQVLTNFIRFGKNAIDTTSMITATPTTQTIVSGTQTITQTVRPLQIQENEAVRLLTEGSYNMPLSMLIVYIISQVLIVIGFFIYAYKKIKHLNLFFITLSVTMFGLLLMSVVFPRFASVVALDRIYPFAMMILSPFLFVALSKWKYIIGSIFIGAFLLFNVGFINELTGEPLENSIALSQSSLDFPIFTQKELEGAQWLQDKTNVYYDSRCYHLFAYASIVDGTNKVNGLMLDRNVGNEKIREQISVGSYIYLRKYNIENNAIPLGYWTYQVAAIEEVSLDSLDGFSDIIKSGIIVFDNGDCRILLTMEKYNGDK